MKPINALIFSTGLLAATLAQAETINTTGFSLEYDFRTAPVVLLSADHGTLRFSLDGYASQMWSVGTDTRSNPDGSNWNAVDTLFTGNVMNGYRVQSLTLSGTVTGSLVSETVPDDCDGISVFCKAATMGNKAELSFSVIQNGVSTVQTAAQKNNVNGAESISAATNQQLSGSFGVYANAFNSVFANQGSVYYHPPGSDFGNYNYLESSASSAFSGPIIFTVQVAAVPEPATYAMMFAGLGLLGLAARRRRQG